MALYPRCCRVSVHCQPLLKELPHCRGRLDFAVLKSAIRALVHAELFGSLELGQPLFLTLTLDTFSQRCCRSLRTLLKHLVVEKTQIAVSDDVWRLDEDGGLEPVLCPAMTLGEGFIPAVILLGRNHTVSEQDVESALETGPGF